MCILHFRYYFIQFCERMKNLERVHQFYLEFLLGKSIIAFQVTVYLNLVRVRVNNQNTSS